MRRGLGRRRAAGAGPALLLVLLGGLWGLHIVFAKAIGAATAREALAVLALYISTAAVGLVLVAALRSRPFRPSAPIIRFFVVSSALGYVGPIFVELLAAPRIDATVLSLIAGATPIATVGIAVAAGRDRLSPALAAALAAGSAAALALLGPAAWAGGGGPVLWIAVAFLVPLLYGAGDVFIETNWPRGLDVYQVAAGEAVVGSGWVLLLSFAAGVRPSDVASIAGPAAWPTLGLIATALAATWLYFALINRAGAVFVSFASYVTIATGVLAGILAFGERPGASLLAAGLLTALALWLLNRDRASAVAREAESGG